jgi:hypothetical protein
MQRIRFTRSARKHRIGRAHVLHVMSTVEPIYVPATDIADPRFVWIGPDDRGVELEIVAVVMPDYLMVIHAMPQTFRRKR